MQVDEAFGASVRRYRSERRLRQRDLGRRLADEARAHGVRLPPVSRQTVSRWEAGHPPTDLYTVLLARVLDVPPTELGDTVGRHLTPDRAGEVLGRAARSDATLGWAGTADELRRTALRFAPTGSHPALPGLTLDWERLGSMLGATQRVDEVALRDMDLLTQLLTQQLPHLAPRTLLPQLSSHLIILRNKLLTAGSERVQRELAGLAGKTAVASGVVWHGLHDHGEAREAYRFALELGHEMNDRVLTSLALMSTALLATRGRERSRRPVAAEAEEGLPAAPGRALELMNHAYSLSATAEPGMRAWMLCSRAFERACQGDEVGSLQDLNQAEGALARIDSGSRFFLLIDPRGEFLLYRGKCAALLGRSKEGVAVFEQALNGPACSSMAMRLWLTVDLASVLLEAGEVDRAAGLLASVWSDVCSHGLTIFQRRIQRFAYHDLGQHAAVLEVRALRERIAADRESGWAFSI